MRGLLLTMMLLALPALGGAQAWDLKGVLRAHVLENFPWAEVALDDIKVSGGLPAEPPAKITIQRNPPGSTDFRLAYSDGTYVLVRGNVKAFDHVVMSRVPLRRGHEIGEEDIYTALMDVGRIPAGAINEEEAALGKTLSRSVGANRPLRASMLERRDRLRRGRKVMMVFESPGLRVMTGGTLKESAAVGEHVRVVNTSSNKVVTGLLLDGNTVMVRF